jgi:uncharacterized membrane protein SirB2
LTAASDSAKKARFSSGYFPLAVFTESFMQDFYHLVKHVHMGAVLASGGFFLLRGLWMMQESSLLSSKFARVLPHIIDTVLLLSAITLVVLLGGLPVWVQVKIAALFVYIFLGMLAFRFAKGYGAKVTAFFLALAVFAFIASVAVSKNPHGFLQVLF